MLEVFGLDWFWCRVIGVFLGLSIYFLTPMRRMVTDKVWDGFIQDFGNPAHLPHLLGVCSYKAGDGNLYLDYPHFVHTIKNELLTDRSFLRASTKLKLMFVIECVGFTVTLYVALASVMICLLVLDFIMRIL